MKVSDENSILSLVQKYEANDLPLEAIWLPCNYNHDKEPFTLDPAKFPNGIKVFNELHEKGIKIIPCVAPYIAKKSSGKYYNLLINEKLSILEGMGKETYIGKTNDGESGFIDFFNPNTYAKLWQPGLKALFAATNFDGLWLDFNEFTTLETNEAYPTDSPFSPKNLNM